MYFVSMALLYPHLGLSRRQGTTTSPNGEQTIAQNAGASLPALRKHRAAGVARAQPELCLDAQQAVVLGDAFAACRSAGLDLAAAQGDGEVRDGGVFGLATAVAHHGAPTRVERAL